MSAIDPELEDRFGGDVEMPASPPPRPRRRIRSVTIEREKIAQRLKEFYTNDLESRSEDRNRRIQRYAKFRMWTEGKSWPWVGSSDLGLPDMMEKSLRVQDTLHNAVMASRPNVMNSRAVNSADKGKEETIDKLLDYQVFVEGRGENRIGELIDSFVNDGVFTAFTPWVKEKRDVCERIEFPAPSDDEDFFAYLESIVRQLFPETIDSMPEDDEGWEWCVYPSEDEKVKISFYTEEDENDAGDQKVLAVVKKYVIVHDGPVIIPLDYDDVIYPAGAANLQPPGPANPGGTPHVLLRSYPTIDEIRALAAQGYYDLVTADELAALQEKRIPSDEQVKKEALDKIQGQSQWRAPRDPSQGTLTRLVCFDRYDIDGDGLAEDVVFWYLVEPNLVLRARHLTEVFPAKVPRRPLAEATFIPAGGRREGISLLEMQEGVHDMMKTLFDITCDSGVLGAMPIFFYRMAGALKPENLQIFPGMGVPVGDPSRDIMFPNIANPNGLGMLLNLISLVGTWGDRSTMIGEFQLGRVPAGKSSALRTTGSVSMLQAQGDARPERILRRFFVGLAQIYANFLDLNRAFLPRGKQIRAAGIQRPDEDPFMTIDGREKIDGQFEFDFQANAFNTSKPMMQQALMQLAGAFLSPIAVQAGVIKPDNIYTMYKDLAKAFGLQPERYLTAPTPDANLPPITAEEALNQIVTGTQPYGRPQEGIEAHLTKISELVTQGVAGELSEKQTSVLETYVKGLLERFMFEQQQMALAAAAQQQQMMGGQDPGGAPAQGVADPNAPPPQVNGGELIDETLPTAGGGGQDAMMAAE